MKALDLLRAELEQMQFKTESLGWRLSATTREMEALRVRIALALGEKPTEAIPLRPLAKARPRDPSR